MDSKTQRQAGCPTQTTDGVNCGMFIVMYMDTLVKNSFVDATSFSASEMPNYRLKLAKAIKNIVKLNKMWNELLVLVNKINLHPSK